MPRYSVHVSVAGAGPKAAKLAPHVAKCYLGPTPEPDSSQGMHGAANDRIVGQMELCACR